MIDEPRYLSEAALDEFLSSGPTTAVRIPGYRKSILCFSPASRVGSRSGSILGRATPCRIYRGVLAPVR